MRNPMPHPPQKPLLPGNLIALCGILLGACSPLAVPISSSIPDTSSCLNIGTELGTVFQTQQFRIACQRATRIDRPLEGTVQAEGSAKALSGVKIIQEIQNPAGTWVAQDSVESDAAGGFRLSFFYGSYRLRFEKAGYQPLSRLLSYEYRAAEPSSAENPNAITFTLRPEKAAN